jgi:hypothetical protein
MVIVKSVFRIASSGSYSSQGIKFNVLFIYNATMDINWSINIGLIEKISDYRFGLGVFPVLGPPID